MSKREMTVEYLTEMVKKSFANVDIDDKGKMCVLPYQSLVDTVDLYENKLAKQHAEIERLSGPIGKFKDQTSLLKAYESLEKEFTRRSQRLKELQKNNDDLVEDLANMTIYPEEAVKRIREQAVKDTAKEIANWLPTTVNEDKNVLSMIIKEHYGVEVE